MAILASDDVLDAAMAPNGWAQAMDVLRHGLDAHHAMIFSNGTSRAAMPFMAVAGLDDGAIASFASERANALWSPWQRAMAPGVAQASHDILSDQVFERLDIYNEIIRPTGSYYGAVIQMTTEDFSFHVSVCREKPVGHYRASQLGNLQKLVHRLAPILSWQRRLHELSLHVGALEQAMDYLPDAVFLFDAWRRPIYLNHAAEASTANDGPFRLTNDGLALHTAEATRALASAMAGVINAAANPGSLKLRIPQQQDTPGLVITVSRGPLPGYVPRGVHVARIAVVIQRDAGQPVLESEIARRYGLTGRETRIALEIASGRNLHDVASALNIGLGTVRSHLKSIFSKTGVSSQAALVSLLLDGGSRIHRP